MAPPAENNFDAAIKQAYRNGYMSHGDLGLDETDFKSHIVHIVEKHVGDAFSTSAAIHFIETLHTNDLYLGVACARRIDEAWNRFNATYRTYIENLASFVTPTPDAAIELADNVFVDLFLPNQSGQSRIASYEGRSSLATWLRVIISHRGINERERICNNIDDADALPDIADQAALYTLNASLRACRYESIVDDSFRCSCQCLTDRERLILLLRYEEELQLGQIARLLGVHQSTITRQLERAYKKLRKEVTTRLSSKYRLDQDAITECQEDILENPSYSILTFIKHVPAPK